MDISKLRKKHKEERGKEVPEGPEEKLEKPLEAEELESDTEEEEPAEEQAEIAPPARAVPFTEEPPQVRTDSEVSAKPAAPEEARKPSREEVSAAAEGVEIVVFQLSDELYAFRVSEVQEVLRPQRVTGVPRVVDFIPGVTSVRGKIIAVMDLKTRLRIDSEAARQSSNIIILKGDDRGPIGVLVDRTIDVLKIAEGEIMQPPSHLPESEARFIEGVAAHGDKFISILHPGELLRFKAAGEGQ